MQNGKDVISSMSNTILMVKLHLNSKKMKTRTKPKTI